MVLPGNIIREYLLENKISQKELATRTGISEKHISNVLNGHARVTEDFALKLEKVMPQIPAAYWLNYECKYREQLARQNEKYHIERTNLKSLAKRFRFAYVFKGLNLSLAEQAIEMLKILGISDFANFDSVYQNLGMEFMEDGGDKEAIVVWLRLCEQEIEIQNDDLEEEHIGFSRSKIKASFKHFKDIANNDNLEMSLKSCRKLCNKFGIYLVVNEAIPGCKVRGALTTFHGNPAIFISCRYKRPDYVWFAIIHEIAHLILHYQKDELIISYEDEDGGCQNRKEEEANAYARDFFINPEDYKRFIAQGTFDNSSIRKFAAQQNVIPAIVVGRLQHDHYLPYSEGGYL